MYSTFQAIHLRPGDVIRLDGASHTVRTVTKLRARPDAPVQAHVVFEGGASWTVPASRPVHAERTPQ